MLRVVVASAALRATLGPAAIAAFLAMLLTALRKAILVEMNAIGF